MRFLKNIYLGLIFTNVFISIAAWSQSMLTYVILSIPVNVHVLWIEFTSTLLLYNVSLYLSKPKRPQESPYLRTRWVFKYEWLLWSNSLLAGGILLYAILHVHYYTWGFLLVVGVLSALYALPLFPIAGARRGIRHVPYFKLFHIAVVWSLSTVGLPAIEAIVGGISIDWYMANYLGIVKIVFLLLLTLPFDIRDMQQDAHYQLKTIPLLLGERGAIMICYGLLAFHSLLILFSPYLLAVKLGLLTTNLAILFVYRFVIFTCPQRYHQVYLLDLGMIVQLLSVLIATKLLPLGMP